MKKIRFSDILTIKPKSKVKAGEGLDKGHYPFFTSSANLSKYIDNYLFDKPSLIFGTGGQASVHYCDSKFNVSTDCFVAQADNTDECNVKFVYYFFKGHLYLLEREFKGAGLKHISKKAIENIKIPLPQLPEQKRIAAILDKADALLQKNKQLLAAYDELLQSVFLDMFGDPVTNPKGWKNISIIENAKCIVPGRDKPKSFTGSIPWITIDDLRLLGSTEKSKKNLGLTNDEINNVRARIIPKGSVLMTCVGELGITSIAGCDMVINQQLHSFQCNEKMNNIFVMFALSFQKGYMYSRATLTTIPYLNKTNCNSIPVIIPPNELQNQFAQIVENIEAQKTLVKQSIKESEDLFNGLVQKAFKGELTGEKERI